ncbi:MAG: alpha/beta hydrolase [Phocaeicola sp.]
MKKKLLLATLFTVATTLTAQTPLVIDLWPNGAPNSNGIESEEKTSDTGRISGVNEPTLTIYVAEKPNGQAIIACPGGGYQHLAMNHEGHDFAPWYNEQGITYGVLKYRMPNGHSDVPLSDVQEAIRIMHTHAAEWSIKKVGVMGSSAGGHLASTAATHFTEDTRPDFQILFYPVISSDSTITHRGSFDNLTGKESTAQERSYFSNEHRVTAQTPPAFILHSSDDKTVPVANAINYYTALIANKVSAALHIYPIGGHGWGFRETFTYKKEWSAELQKWLEEINR